MKIIKADIKHLNHLIPLFDDYRIFYEQPSNKDSAKLFLTERLKNQDSIIYLAFINNLAVGFTQLYHSFSSVSMQEIYILNDLYVNAQYRGQGIGEALINEAKTLCVFKKYKGLALQTGITNPAQYLYERLDFKKDTDLQYFWMNNEKGF